MKNFAQYRSDRTKILPGERVAIVWGPRAAYSFLFEELDVQVIVYSNGNDIGLIRRDGESLRMDHPRFQRLVKCAGEWMEWFPQPDGFLYCRRFPKGTPETPSKVSPEALAEAANNLLRKEG